MTGSVLFYFSRPWFCLSFKEGSISGVSTTFVGSTETIFATPYFFKVDVTTLNFTDNNFEGPRAAPGLEADEGGKNEMRWTQTCLTTQLFQYISRNEFSVLSHFAEMLQFNLTCVCTSVFLLRTNWKLKKFQLQTNHVCVWDISSLSTTI